MTETFTFRANECQIYLDVDCSSLTYESEPSPVVLDAVNKTLEKIETESSYTESSSSTSPNASLANSLLSSMDPATASKEEIKEAFCRDVDTFSWEFAKPEQDGPWSWLTNPFAIFIVVFIPIGMCAAMYANARHKQAKNDNNGGGNNDNEDQSLPYPAHPGGDERQSTAPEVGTAPPQYSVQPSDGVPYPIKPGSEVPYPVKPNNEIPYPVKPDNSLPYPVQPGTSIPQPPVQSSENHQLKELFPEDTRPAYASQNA